MSQDTSRKIKTLEGLCEELAELRSRGRTVVLANGVFDLFHVGHVRYLQGARAEGDFLVVAVNSDDSVRELKGVGRPFMPAAERAEIVAALECVDRVMIFSERTVGELLTTLRPDVHAKGTDYEEAWVPERETVIRYGGQVSIVGPRKEWATTELVRRIRALNGFTKSVQAKCLRAWSGVSTSACRGRRLGRPPTSKQTEPRPQAPRHNSTMDDGNGLPCLI